MTRNINQLGSGDNFTDKVKFSETYPYYEAVVEDVVLNEEGGTTLRYLPDGSNIGEIRIRAIPVDRGVPVEKLRTAYPLEANIQEYPLIGELVIVFKAFGGLYYTRPIAYTRKLTENSANAIRRKYSFGNVVKNSDNRELSKNGVVPEVLRTVDANQNLGKYFPNPNSLVTRNIRPCEGDVLIQGRFGNAIRMGSSLFSNTSAEVITPNILLTAGIWETPRQVSAVYGNGAATPYALTYENINKDKSSIWMVANETIPFLASTALSVSPNKAHLYSSPTKTAEYNGAQIFINSDRIILNSKLNEISLFSNTEINLSAIKSITIDTEKTVFIRAFDSIDLKADQNISIEAKQISINSTNDLAFSTTGNYSILGKKIFLGKYGDTSQPMVLGSTLALWLQSLLTMLTSSGAILTSTGPATFNPVVIAVLNTLKLQLGTSQTPFTAVFNSRDNFTSETNSV